MREKKNLDWWCHRAWIKFSCGITAVVMIMILINWQNWSTALKFIASIAALIPIHVVEEWVFPGGFHYQYNVGLNRSEYPNCYPMCRLSDMFTNLLGTLFFVVLTIIFALKGTVPNGVVMGTIVFCAMELLVHTVIGTDWLVCVGVLAFIALGCILIPENAIKRKDSPYEFESAGYYERFLD